MLRPTANSAFPRLFSRQAPPVIILFNGALACLLVWLPFTLLIEFSMLLLVICTVLFLCAFLHLKYTRPTMLRPFNIPGGMPVALLVAFWPFAVAATMIYFSCADDEIGTVFPWGWFRMDSPPRRCCLIQ